MQNNNHWHNLGWQHPMWDVLRYYRSLRGEKNKTIFLTELSDQKSLSLESKTLPIPDDIVDYFFQYLKEEKQFYEDAEQSLRTEKNALAFCEQLGFTVGKTKTQSQDHHQSSKAMIACVTGIAMAICNEKQLTIEPDPQNRCVWLKNNQLHVTSRNLDGAIPGLANPSIVWEIKEYWGKTKGGSKMSDAVYECQLVGRELREYEEKTDTSVVHVVFLDGKEQWSHRKSDLKRFIDLNNQGLIDHLIVGTQVEEKWEKILRAVL